MDCAETGTIDRRVGAVRVPRRRSVLAPDQRAAQGVGRLTTLRAVPREIVAPSDDAPSGEEQAGSAPGRHNLPHALTSFVGREHEVAEARRLLNETWLLTLTGAGGIGKTRLGHAIAAGLLGELRDGVWLVELSALADPTLVPRAVAAVLGVRELSERPLAETLTDALRSRQMLLMLDNCEHLIEACAQLAERLLRACPELRILATSRQPLGIAGETTFRVPPLALSTQSAVPPFVAVSDLDVSCAAPIAAGPDALISPSEAARLFVERARAVVPAFSLTERNAPAVEQICRRLDGIPLAVELAAARIAVLSPEQIAGRLDDRFHLLSGGSRTAPSRYRTLRALVDWSHALLTDAEQVLFRRLAVFAGGWSLEAAEAVCSGADLAPGEILDLLSGLVSKSLVLTGEPADAVRYGLLETLREYAAEKLREAGEALLLRERHAAWHLTLAERAEPELIGPCQEAWLNRLERDRENLRTAQRWAVEGGDVETVARLGAALWRFWWARADAADAREWLTTIVPLAEQAPPSPSVVRALDGAGRVAGALADFPTCRLLLDAGLAVARQLGDRHLLATLLDSRGRQSFVEAHYAEARPLLNECLAILRELGDRHGLARVLSHLGFLEYLENRQGAARALYHDGLKMARAVGDPNAVAELLDSTARTFQAEGDFDAALSSYREAEAILREIGQSHRLAMVLNNLGSVHTRRGELGAARACLAEALSLSEKIGNRRRLAFTLASAATLAAISGEPERAVRLQTVAAYAVAEMGASLAQPMCVESARDLDRARLALGPEAVSAAVAAGRALTLVEGAHEALAWLAAGDRPVADAIELPDQQPAAPHALPPAPAPIGAPVGGQGLSPRELEVAALVARGMTNRQIAGELIITEGTAANHVKHILARLTLDSRVQIAAWAVQRGLHLSASV